MKTMFLFSLGYFLLGGAALGENVVTISNINDFIEFSNNVNSGTTFEGTTVFLSSDIEYTDELLSQFKAVGYFNNWGDYAAFRGVFDGQGHTIGNIKVNSSSLNTALFPFSDGITIRNVVIDDSSSVVSYSPDSSRYWSVNVGSFIGYCTSSGHSCIVESSVSMASVTYSMYEPNSEMRIGGLVGCIYGDGNANYLKNSVNYGSITAAGVSEESYVGGVIGQMYGDIESCLNYGTITYDRTVADDFYIGGVVGYFTFGALKNSVSHSTILSPNMAFVGGIVGYSGSSSISHCYWNTASSSEMYVLLENTTVSGGAKFDADFVLNESVAVGSFQGTSLVEALNAYSGHYDLYDYSRWVLNKNEKSVSFKVNDAEISYAPNSKIVLLPNFAAGGGKLWFDGWYVDSACTTKLSVFDISAATKLYGKIAENNNEYTITFDTRGGTPISEPVKARFGTTVALPNNTVKDNCRIIFWEDKFDKIEEWNYTVSAHDITLYAFWQCTRISTPEEFSAIRRAVIYGNDYFGTTVYLDSDLDFDGKPFEIIGTYNRMFSGTFDGQGHTFSNVAMKTSTWKNSGLFGRLNGGIVKNVVIDDSCSFTSVFYIQNYVYPTAGSIAGECYTEKDNCLVENIVNMANVAFIGNIKGDTALGGIVGSLSASDDFEATVRNCANYGSVANSGDCRRLYIGGIVGYTYRRARVQNSLNYGTLSTSGVVTDKSYVGGIAGEGDYILFVENCLSAGAVSVSGASTLTGGIIGLASRYNSVNHSFWTSDLGLDLSGGGTPTTDAETSQVSVGTELLGKLNGYASSSSWNRWILNANDTSVSFSINRGKVFTVESQVILLPSITDTSDYTFSGWHMDEALTTPFDSDEVSYDITLYGMYCGSNLVVTFDVNGGDPLDTNKMPFECYGEYGTFSTPTKVGYTFDGWFTGRAGGVEIESGSTVRTGGNHTLYAHWSLTLCTVTFDLGNGTSLSDIIEYGQTFTYPEGTEREGYTFAGWFEDKACTKPFEGTIVTEDITIYAKYVVKEGSEGSGSGSHGSFSIGTSPVSALLFALLLFLL